MEAGSRLYITRKRKKWKFAHFDEWPNCFTGDKAKPRKWPKFFGDKDALIIEVGAGTADLSVGLAGQRPNEHFVAVDIKSDRLYTGAKFALEHHIENIAFVRSHIANIESIFAARSVKELWITFPDPFPRKKQAKHRLTHPAFLERYAALLSDDGVLHFKTDNRDLFLWSLEQFVGLGWRLEELSFDLHESELSAEYMITTAYERRFMAEGTQINFLSATPPKARITK